MLEVHVIRVGMTANLRFGHELKAIGVMASERSSRADSLLLGCLVVRGQVYKS